MTSYLLLVSGLTLIACGILMTSNRKRLLLTSGLAAAPAGWLDIIFTPEYWQPNQVFGAGFSVEGVLFSFANGVLIAWVAFAPWRTMFVRPSPGRALMRSVEISLPCWVLFYLLWHRGMGLAGLTIMHAALAGLGLAALLLLLRRRETVSLALFSGAAFAVIYSLELAVWSWIDPAAPAMWNHDVAWGWQVFGFPLEELAWAGLYGAVWAMAIAYGASVHLRPKRAGERFFRLLPLRPARR